MCFKPLYPIYPGYFIPIVLPVSVFLTPFTTIFSVILRPFRNIGGFDTASTGKKANERGSKRKRQNNPPRDVALYGDRVPVTAEDANEEANAPYEVMFVHSTSATTCYGCKGRVRDKPSAPLPPAPYDIFIRHEERRVYNRAGKLELELALNLRWYTTIRYVLVPALTRIMWKRGDLLFQERSMVYLPRCIGVTFVRSSSWN